MAPFDERFRRELSAVANARQLQSEQYQRLDFAGKVDFWSGHLHQLMRNQVESGLDEYKIYSRAWYEGVKKYEPRFDDIMTEVFQKKWKNYWDESEYKRRISSDVS